MFVQRIESWGERSRGPRPLQTRPSRREEPLDSTSERLSVRYQIYFL
jgi:hypothetical protein